MMSASAEGLVAPVAVIYRFHHFALMPLARSLRAGGQPVRLSSRAFDVLVYLVRHADEIVSRQRLIAHVWPSTIVEDVNLRVQMSALRKALSGAGDGYSYIERVPGVGYRFAAPVEIASVERGAPPATAAEATDPQQRARQLSSWSRPLLGREALIADLMRDLSQHRLCSIVGPAGSGKSVVAREVAARLGAGLKVRTCVVDLGALAEQDSLAQAIAAALGLAWRGTDGMVDLLGELRRGRTLLLLDNCECQLQQAALAAQWLLQLPQLWMLATSRAVLQVRGETVVQLPPLALPAETAGLSAAAALAYPGIALFCERAGARSGFILRDQDVDTLVALCLSLDGLPLAIELAAARTELFSIDEIADQLIHRFHLLADGRRTGQQRHRTMWDALDCGFQRLSAQERIVLRRLSVFQRCFDLDSAVAAASCLFMPAACVPRVVQSLVAKSLVAGGAGDGYHLLHGMRDYAHVQLLASGDTLRFPGRWAPQGAAGKMR